MKTVGDYNTELTAHIWLSMIAQEGCTRTKETHTKSDKLMFTTIRNKADCELENTFLRCTSRDYLRNLNINTNTKTTIKTNTTLGPKKHGGAEHIAVETIK